MGISITGSEDISARRPLRSHAPNCDININDVPDASMIVPEKVDEASVLSERTRSANSSRSRPTRPTQSERVAIAPPPALRARPSRRPCMAAAAAARSLAPAAHRLDCPTSQSCDRTRRHTPRRAASTPAPRGKRGSRPSLQQRARLEVTRQCERAAPHEPPSAMPSAAGGTAALEARSLFGGDALFGGEALLGARLCYGGRGSVTFMGRGGLQSTPMGIHELSTR